MTMAPWQHGRMRLGFPKGFPKRFPKRFANGASFPQSSCAPRPPKHWRPVAADPPRHPGRLETPETNRVEPWPLGPNKAQRIESNPAANHEKLQKMIENGMSS